MKMPSRWVRRFIGPLVIYVVLAAIVGALPIWLIVAAIASHWLPGKWRALRLLAMALVGLVVEAAALLMAFGLWVASGFGWKLRSPAFMRAHYTVLRTILDILVGSGRQLFSLKLQTDEVSWSPLDDGVPGSTNAMVVLARHAGPGDSFLLMQTLMNRDHLRHPRVVLKYTMALDPMVDVYLHRLPARFVNPNPGPGEDVESYIATMAGGLGDEDALLIFPEGGNFTPNRWKKSITKLQERGYDEYAERAAQMPNVLPPRPGGVSAALDAAPGADVVLVAHTGLEHIGTIKDVWLETPVDKTLHLRWWFFPAAEVPTERDERIDWLYNRWADVDAWITANTEPRD